MANTEDVTADDATMASETTPAEAAPASPPASEAIAAAAAADLSDSSDSESDDMTQKQTEWLATTRQRRATAGNRMKAMLANEEPDSDLELLFAEDEDDAGFSDAGDDGSDAHMDSSSDEEDGNNNKEDDMEGERELEKQAREKKAAQRKRKAQDAIPAKFRKKVRITTEAPAPRPKKKSERASWLPSVTDMPTRASARSTTRMSKESLHQQMVEREARRLKQVAQMQKKAARLEAMKRPPMTQEERLREAERVEERNSKSLNRWEEAEKAREEERMRKLAALNERRLDGPVITFWSGVREGQGRGVYVSVEEKPVKKKREPKVKKGESAPADVGTEGSEASKEATAGTAKGETGEASQAEEKGVDTAKEIAKPEGEQAPQTQSAVPGASASTELPRDEADKVEGKPPAEDVTKDAATTADASASTETPAQPPEKKISDAPQAATQSPESRPKEAQESMAVPSTDESETKPPRSAPAPEPPKEQEPKQESQQQTSTDTFASLPADALPFPQDDVPAPLSRTENGDATTVAADAATEDQDKPAPSSPAAPKATETRAQNAIVFQNFNDHALRDKSVQTHVLFGQKMPKLSKPPPAPICVITRQHARYRDPFTGLPFATAHAYREIRRLVRGEHRWSRNLGAWVGSGVQAARGVPARFLQPEAEGPKKSDEKKGTGQGEGQQEVKKEGMDGMAGETEAKGGKQTAEEARGEDIVMGEATSA